MRVIELKVEVDTVVALTLHPRLTVVDAGAPNDRLVGAVRSLVSGEPIKLHAVVSEGDGHHLRDADELRARGWTSDAVLLDIEHWPTASEHDAADTRAATEASVEGPLGALAAKVSAATRAAEAAEVAAARSAEALTAADASSDGIIAALRAHEEAIEELKAQRAEVEARLRDLDKRQAVIAGHLDTLARLRSEAPRSANEVVTVVERFDALPPESIDEIRAAMANWNRPVLSTYDLLMGSQRGPSSLEEQFGLAPREPGERALTVVQAQPLEEKPPLPDEVLEHLDKAQLTLTAQAERIKDIRGTIQAAVDERTKAVNDRQRQLNVARAGMLARTGERETLRHQHERALEAAAAAHEQLADLAVARRLVHHIARMPSDPIVGRPTLVIEHHSNDEARRDQLLRALPVVSGETQVVVVTSDAKVLDWARRLSGVDGALRSASAL